MYQDDRLKHFCPTQFFICFQLNNKTKIFYRFGFFFFLLHFSFFVFHHFKSLFTQVAETFDKVYKAYKLFDGARNSLTFFFEHISSLQFV